jgi:hypothetical protein
MSNLTNEAIGHLDKGIEMVYLVAQYNVPFD